MMKLLIAITCLFYFTIVGINAQQISSNLVGTNVWYFDPGETVWKLTQECGVRSIRIGGHSYDKKLPSKETLLDWVKKIQQVGAEPILQVSQYQSPENAADLVRFFNIEKKRRNISCEILEYWK